MRCLVRKKLNAQKWMKSASHCFVLTKANDVVRSHINYDILDRLEFLWSFGVNSLDDKDWLYNSTLVLLQAILVALHTECALQCVK